MSTTIHNTHRRPYHIIQYSLGSSTITKTAVSISAYTHALHSRFDRNCPPLWRSGSPPHVQNNPCHTPDLQTTYIYFFNLSMSNVFYINGRKNFLNSHWKNICNKTLGLHVLYLSQIHLTLKVQSIRIFFLWIYILVGVVTNLCLSLFSSLFSSLSLSLSLSSIQVYIGCAGEWGFCWG